jgi:hypothetical protein
MVNITEQANLVREAKGFHPVADHELVVFRKVGDGLKFKEIVPPNCVFKPRLFESTTSFVAYAVSKDDSLRHVFHREFDYKDQTRSFTLRFALVYQVANPLRLIEKLSTDPLLRIEQEAGEIFRVALRPVDWSVIEDEAALERTCLFQQVADGTGASTNLDLIQRFARKIGIEIRSVSISRILNEEELRVAKAKKKVHENLEIEQAAHEYRIQRVEHEQQITGLDDGQKVRSTMADATADVITRAAGEIRTFGEVRQTLPDLQAIKAGIQGLTSSGPQTPGTTAGGGFLAPASMPQLPAHVAMNGSLGGLLSQTLGLINGLACEPGDKRRITSAALHLIAEALQGSEAEEAVAHRYSEALGQEMRKLFRELSDEQTQFLRSLQDSGRLKSELS